MKKLLDKYVILLIIGLALILRLPHLNGSFWLDEAAQALESARPLWQQFNIVADFQPPLIHLLVHLATYFGTQEWWLRAIAALIPGLVTIWATYQIGKKLINQKVALVAAILLSTSSFHIFYSQELRPYSLPTMFACLSWLTLLHLCQTKKLKPITKKIKLSKPLVLLTVLNVLGLYTSYLYPFLILSQVVYIILSQRKYLKSMILSGVVTLAAFAPWLPMFLKQLQAGGQVRQSLPGWESAVSISQAKSIPLVFGKFIFGILDIQITLLFVAIGLLLVLFVVIAGWQLTKETKLFGLLKSKTKESDKHQALLILLIWLFVPLLTAWLVSFKIPVVRPKRLLMLLPAFYLLAASSLQLKQKKRVGFIIVGLLLTLNIYSTLNYYTDVNLQRENWRQLHQTISQKFSPNDTIIVFVAPDVFSPWRWYDQDSFPTWATQTLHIDQVSDLKTALKPIHQYNQILVFDYLRDLSDPDNKIVSEIKAFGYEEIGAIDQKGIGFVRILIRKGSLIGES